MAIRHIAFLKFKEGVDKTTIEAHIAELTRIGGLIDGFIRITSGEYVSEEGLNQGYNYAFTMEFRDETARNAYLVHPEHKAEAGKIVANLDPEGVIPEDVKLKGGVIFDYRARTPSPGTKMMESLTGKDAYWRDMPGDRKEALANLLARQGILRPEPQRPDAEEKDPLLGDAAHRAPDRCCVLQ